MKVTIIGAGAIGGLAGSFMTRVGFDVTLVADAHTCMDTPQLSAKMIIEHHNATLGAALVKRLDTAQVKF